MPSNPLRRYHHGVGPWALVTGATGGMGYEWACQLGALGFNVVIHGRSQDKLDGVKADVLKQSKGDIEVRTLLSDASSLQPDLSGLETLVTPRGLRLTVVINNLGVVSKGYPLQEEVKMDDAYGMIAANMVFPTLVATKTLPALKRNQPSLLVNVTSLGAWAPSPYLAIYSGTKSYNLMFSRSLYNEMELEKVEVDVVAVAPGQVVSGMNEGPPTKMMPTSAAWVKQTLASLAPGFFSSRPAPVIVPWGMHALGARIMAWLPRSMADGAVRSTVGGLRKKELQEKQKEQSTAQPKAEEPPQDLESAADAPTAVSSSDPSATEAKTPST